MSWEPMVPAVRGGRRDTMRPRVVVLMRSQRLIVRFNGKLIEHLGWTDLSGVSIDLGTGDFSGRLRIRAGDDGQFSLRKQSKGIGRWVQMHWDTPANLGKPKGIAVAFETTAAHADRPGQVVLTLPAAPAEKAAAPARPAPAKPTVVPPSRSNDPFRGARFEDDPRATADFGSPRLPPRPVAARGGSSLA